MSVSRSKCRWIGGFLVIGLGLYAGSVVAQGLACGTHASPSSVLSFPLQPFGSGLGGPGLDDCAADSNNPAAAYDPSGGLMTVPIVLHIIMDDDCEEGAISDEQVQVQLDILNQDYLALPDSPGSPGVDTQIRFELAGVTRSCNSLWHSDSGEYWNTLAWDPYRYLNFYTHSAGGSGGYVPVIPAADPQLIGDPSDRVVVNALGFGTDGPVPGRQGGRLATHEIGHYLGLWHTFRGSCGVATEPECHTTGDLLCDTPPDAEQSDKCPIGATSCGGVPVPIDNYMQYTDDDCMDGFTLEQAKRMRCTLMFYRPGLLSLFSDGFESGDFTSWSTTSP